jgi:hypothetical protein
LNENKIMNWKIKIFTLLVLCVGCSVIDKSLFLKSRDKNNGWRMIKNKNYIHNFPFKTPWDSWSSYQYYSFDSISSLALFFSNIYYKNTGREFVSTGPPFIPIFPLSIIDRFSENPTFTVQIKVSTFNYDEIDSLLLHINFIFNDTLRLSPYDTKIVRNAKYIDNLYDGIVCNKSHTNIYYSVSLKFKKASFKLNKLSIFFDKEFNHQLNSNYKNLDLIKKNRYSYSPFNIK